MRKVKIMKDGHEFDYSHLRDEIKSDIEDLLKYARHEDCETGSTEESDYLYIMMNLVLNEASEDDVDLADQARFVMSHLSVDVVNE